MYFMILSLILHTNLNKKYYFLQLNIFLYKFFFSSRKQFFSNKTETVLIDLITIYRFSIYVCNIVKLKNTIEKRDRTHFKAN